MAEPSGNVTVRMLNQIVAAIWCDNRQRLRIHKCPPRPPPRQRQPYSPVGQKRTPAVAAVQALHTAPANGPKKTACRPQTGQPLVLSHGWRGGYARPRNRPARPHSGFALAPAQTRWQPRHARWRCHRYSLVYPSCNLYRCHHGASTRSRRWRRVRIIYFSTMFLDSPRLRQSRPGSGLRSSARQTPRQLSGSSRKALRPTQPTG